MIFKKATQVGNQIIRTKAKKVFDPRSLQVQKIVKDLIDSMHYHNLVGMAAPQIGQGVRVFVTEIRKTKFRKGSSKKVDDLRIYINPRITWRSKKEIWSWEGCGSVASSALFGQVRRSESVIIEAVNQKGEVFNLKATGLLARIIQHECDHLDGVVFTDRADSQTYMSREEYIKQIKNKR